MNDDVVYLTAEGHQKLTAELEELTTTKRAELAERLESAIKMGDLKENADYHYAKQEQAFIEGRILEVQYSLRNSKIIVEDGPTDSVRVGTTVTMVEEGTDFEEVYRIVGGHEASPADGLISNESPMGTALIGRKVGDIAKVSSPGGLIPFKILKIE